MINLKKLFRRNGAAEREFVEESPPEHAAPSKARNEYYEDLIDQQRESAANLLFGSDEVEQDEAMKMVKKIMPRTTADLRVSAAGIDPIEAADLNAADTDMAVAQDAAPAGQVQGGELGPSLLRNTDVYQVYALINPRILRHFVSRAFIGYPACTILAQHEVIGLCCAMPPEDAVSPGFKLTCTSSAHKSGDEHIQDEISWLEGLHAEGLKSGIEELCIKFGTYKRVYGIGIAIPRVKLKDGHSFKEAYDPALIKPGSFKGFTVIDPSRVTWEIDEASLYDPLSEWYQRPEYLRLNTAPPSKEGLGEDRRIHRSWLITSNYREVGEDLLATYLWGGQPLTQIIYERVFCADTLANEIVALASSKRCVVKDGNMKQMINNPKATNLFISRFNGYRNNSSIVFKEPGETVTQLETSLADLHPLSAQQFQYVAAYSGIPMTKLFKNVPSGLQATGQYEVEDYEETIRPIRKDNTLLINRWYEMYIASAYEGRSDLQVTVQWNPFVSPKAPEVQQIASGRSSMVCQLLQNHAITVTEGRAILKSGENATFSILADETPELLKKIEDMGDPEKQQQLQMAGIRGMGGMPPGTDPTQPVSDPNFAQNKGMFEQVLEEVTGKSAEGSEANPQEQPDPAETAPATAEESPAPSQEVPQDDSGFLPPGK